MSADNYYIVDVHPLGGYGVEMGFASRDEDAKVTEKSERFDTLTQATEYALSGYSEYGVQVSQRAQLQDVREGIIAGLKALSGWDCGDANRHIDIESAIAVVSGARVLSTTPSTEKE